MTARLALVLAVLAGCTITPADRRRRNAEACALVDDLP